MNTPTPIWFTAIYKTLAKSEKASVGGSTTVAMPLVVTLQDKRPLPSSK